MKNLNYQTGRVGENLAREYLIKKGYRILQSNFHTRFGEIDLIAAKNQKLIFVEVKTKIGDQFGTPEDMIDKRKLGKIQMMAEVFLQKNPPVAKQYPAYQIDAVCLVLGLDNEIIRINHWEDLGSEMV